jgi:ubiquinone/menaquinone biosynthesis C-methylase UbiE
MEWFENDDHWETLYPLLFDEKHLASGSHEAELVLRLARLTPPATILDLCCGPARHAVFLAKEGFEVTGVDRSPFLLKKALARIEASQVQIELVQADMREFVRPKRYNLILNLYKSFGYFQTRCEDLAVLRNVCASLKAGGKFVLETVNKDFLKSRNCHTRWEQIPDGTLSIQHYQPLGNWSRIAIQWVLVVNNYAKRFDYEHNLYSDEDLRLLLGEAGFQEVRFYGSLAGTPYNERSTNLIAVAER